jgi:Na+/melibiose symporter-like transporter
MNVDELKREFQQRRTPTMDLTAGSKHPADFRPLLGMLRQQDSADQRFVLTQKALPLGIGILLFSILVAVNPIHNPVMLAGCLLVMFTLLLSLVLVLYDYMNISRESFDTSVMEFLREKERRLRSWRTTALKYHLIMAAYIIGVVMLTLGNTAILRDFTTKQITIYIASIVALLIFFWVLGELRCRKRHQEKHRPLLNMIAEMRGELHRDP